MAKSKYLLHPNHPLRTLVYIVLALGLVVGGIVTFKASQTSTEGRSKAAEIISILKPSWEFNQNGNSEGWEGMNFGYQISGGLLSGTILGKPVPLPLGQSLEAKEGKNNKPKKQNQNVISDNSGPGMPIANVESYLVNSTINKEMPPGLKGVTIRMSVSVPESGNSVSDSEQAVKSKPVRIIDNETSVGNNRKSRNNCTECKFGKFCPLFIEKIPGFCKVPPSGCYYQEVQCIQAPCKPELICVTPTPPCTQIPPPCEGIRCPKFPTVIPPGGWCPSQPPGNLTFRLEYSAVNMLPQGTPQPVGSNYLPSSNPTSKPLFFDVIADGQMHEYQVQFPNIDKFDLNNLKIVFDGAPAGAKVSFDYIRLVSLVEIIPITPTPTITPPNEPVSCKVEVYSANSTTRSPYSYATPIDTNINYIKPGDYYLYALRIFNNTNKNLGSFSATAQQLQGNQTPLSIVNSDDNCSFDNVSKSVKCSVPNALGPNSSALTSASFVGRVLTPILRNKVVSLSTLYSIETELGKTSCAEFQWFSGQPIKPCPTPPTCEGQLTVGDPQDTSQCPVYQCALRL